MGAAVTKDAKIYVAGHRGMVGSAIVRRLRAGGYENLVLPARAQLDLLNQIGVNAFLKQEKHNYIFIAAAKVGGIQAKNVSRAEFIYENLLIEFNHIHAADLADVHCICFLGYSCMYSRDCAKPIMVEY